MSLSIRNAPSPSTRWSRAVGCTESLRTSGPASRPTILPETSFWSRPLHLARARSLQGVRLVISRRLQPCPVRTPQARIARQRTLLQHRHRPLPFRFYARQTILTPLTATETRDRCQSASQASRLVQFNSANTLTTVLKNCSLWTDTSLVSVYEL